MLAAEKQLVAAAAELLALEPEPPSSEAQVVVGPQAQLVMEVVVPLPVLASAGMRAIPPAAL